MNNKLTDLSNDIISQSFPKDMYGNPLIILMVISIIVNAIRVIQECNKNDEKNIQNITENVQVLCSKKSWFTKMRLKKIMRKTMSREDYKQYGNSLVNAILNKGETITEDNITVLLEASNV
jgi:hypothetical protein